ncbi:MULTISPECIES: hypothetical protein [unclassified Streptomyces]|uniref:hypothetical protein n=1 Tax=unclassified Streptomyces TaxID=2593676 RepID=UPI00236685F2|nr:MULTISPECIES: hypothetical protein [unclassified Streptomyces]MDF3143070.1 hypothetical protein [Streptomyces sp. T21Q-yed]WDF43027.1 hypothetical protein PBV52_42660 [Streptomyces sp. T12]
MNAPRPRRPLTTALAVLAALVLTSTAASAGTANPPPASTGTTAAPAPQRIDRQVTVSFRTVPAVPGVRLRFGAEIVTTDTRGRASYTASHTLAQQTLRLLDTTVDTGQRRYRFARWSGQRDPDQAFRPVVHGLPLRADYTVTAAFTVAYPVSPRFTDQHGTPLDLRHISQVTVKSSTGRLTDLPVRGTTWLDGAIPVYRSSRLDVTPVTYSLQSLVYDGAQLADAGRQRFSPNTRRTVTFTGPFHNLRITAHDAVFGGGTGRRAEVTGPDKKTHSVRLDDHHSAVLTHLPRGEYRVTVKEPGGISQTQSLQLSRSTTTNVPVISRLDTLVVAVPLLVLGTGVVLLHRSRRKRPGPGPRRLRRGPSSDDAGTTPRTPPRADASARTGPP